MVLTNYLRCKMTIDERQNNLEDQIRELKKTINHNNDVSRKVINKLNDLISGLQTQVDTLKTQNTANNMNMGDIFNQTPFGGKR